MAKVAIRNLWERKLRTVLTSLAIVLGVMMVSGTYILTDTIDRSFDEIFTESNEGIDAVVSSREAVETDDSPLPPFSADVLRTCAEPTASRRPRARSATPRSRSSAPTASRAAATALRASASRRGPSASTR